MEVHCNDAVDAAVTSDDEYEKFHDCVSNSVPGVSSTEANDTCRTSVVSPGSMGLHSKDTSIVAGGNDVSRCCCENRKDNLHDREVENSLVPGNDSEDRAHSSPVSDTAVNTSEDFPRVSVVPPVKEGSLSGADVSTSDSSAKERRTGGKTENSENDETTEFGVDEERLAALDLEQSSEQLEERLLHIGCIKVQANTRFKVGDMSGASELYTQALRQCPLTAKSVRAVLFSNRAACRAAMVIDKADTSDATSSPLENWAGAGTQNSPLAGALADCARAVQLDTEYERARRRYARLLERAGGQHLDTSLEQWREIAQRLPGDAEAKMAMCRIPAMINERNERLKSEMLSKLKNLGDLVLRPFGMSTDNFKMEPTESGGYNIKFSQ